MDPGAKMFRQAGVNFINVKRANFTYESLFSSYVLALNKHLYEKRTSKTLMKLTTGVNFTKVLQSSFFVPIVLL